MEAAERGLHTAEEFYGMFEETTQRIELIEGVVVIQESPTTKHQLIVGGVYSAIAGHIKSKGGSCQPFVSPVDVRLDERNVVQPDVLVICDPSKLDDKRVTGAPDFVAEVVSSDTSRDYNDKLDIYRKAGVREYWIIDPERKRTLVYLFGDPVNVGFYDFDKPVPVGIFGDEPLITVAELI